MTHAGSTFDADDSDRTRKMLNMIAPSSTQSGPRTRAAFEYQDQCVALTILERLLSGQLEGVLVEYSTDLVVFPIEGSPELVSVKHRSPNQSGSSGWTFAQLKKHDVLGELYRFWSDSGGEATATVYTPAGLQGDAIGLIGHHADPKKRAYLVEELPSHGVAAIDAAAFAAHLYWPIDPLPRAREIVSVIHDHLRDLLELTGRPDFGVDEAYSALLETILDTATERPEGFKRYATVARSTANTFVDLTDRRYLSADRLTRLILSAAGTPPQELIHPSDLFSDPDFIVREHISAQIIEALVDQDDGKHRTIALVGPSGSGKSALALKYAESAPAQVSIAILDGSDRAALITSLHRCFGGKERLSIPSDANLIVLVDGVTDPDTISGIVPRISESRIIVTSTRSDLDNRIGIISVGAFEADEADQYLQGMWSELTDRERKEIAAALDRSPLALTQAASVARTLGISGDTYLEILHASPGKTLEMGKVDGHPVPIARSVAIALQSLATEAPASSSLLTLLSMLGPFQIATSWLSADFSTPLNGDEMFRAYPGGLPRGPEALMQLLGDRASLYSAMNELTSRHLVRTIGGRFVIHSLVAEIEIGRNRDPIPILEVAFSLLSRHFTSGYGVIDSSIEQDVPIALRILRIADSLGATGPVVPALCIEFSAWIALVGEPIIAAQLAERGNAWRVRLQAEDRIGAEYSAYLDLRYAHAQFALGNPALGLEVLEASLTRVTSDGAIALEAGEAVVPLLSGYADILMDESSRRLDQVLHFIRRARRAGVNDPSLAAIQLQVELNLAWLSGDGEAARDLLPRALAAYEECEMDSSRIIRYGIALARHDPLLDSKYWAGRLEIHARRSEAGGPSLVSLILTEAADAYLDCDDVDNAGRLLESAREILNGRPAALQTEIELLASEGRFELERALTWDGPRREAALTLGRSRLLDSLGLLESTSSSTKTSLPSVLLNLAAIELLLRNYPQALGHASEALRLDVRRFGENHPESVADRAMVEEIEKRLKTKHVFWR